MPGWNVLDRWHNNIAYAPGPWIALHRMCEKHGVGDQFRIHYDPSHAILMGQDTRSLFQYLKDEGYGFLIGGFHVKGQVVNSRGVSAWGYGGQTMNRGDWINGKPSPKAEDAANAWKKQVVLAEHELPGTARHDPLAYLQNRTVDWLDHQLAARELLSIDPADTYLVVEHEYPPARIQDKSRLAPILKGSLAFVKAIDEAAAAMFALQHAGSPVLVEGRPQVECIGHRIQHRRFRDIAQGGMQRGRELDVRRPDVACELQPFFDGQVRIGIAPVARCQLLKRRGQHAELHRAGGEVSGRHGSVLM